MQYTERLLQRLTALEQGQRRLRWGFLAAALAVGMGMLGIGGPQQAAAQMTAREPQGIPQRVTELEGRVEQLASELAAERAARIAADRNLQTAINAARAEVDGFNTRLSAVERTLAPISLRTVDGLPCLVIEGVNVSIRNGLGATNGNPAFPSGNLAGDTGAVNGLGNLIIGYNESRAPLGGTDDRSGSHMLVVGTGLNYSSFGGIVVGLSNSATGPWSSVSGGFFNTAVGRNASISGGFSNIAVGDMSSVSGGGYNTSGEFSASVSGGYQNAAAGRYASVSGGYLNSASGDLSSVSGGAENRATHSQASVSGGLRNAARREFSSVSGGIGNTAGGHAASVSGGALITQSGDSGWSAGSKGAATIANTNFSSP